MTHNTEKNTVVVVMNEQTVLIDDQQKVLDAEFGVNGWDIFFIPQGFSDKDMDSFMLSDSVQGKKVVLVSPTDHVMRTLSFWENDRIQELSLLLGDNRYQGTGWYID